MVGMHEYEIFSSGWRVYLHFVLSVIAAILTNLTILSKATALELSLPVQCELNKTCFVQNYVDTDVSQARRDFACGEVTYDGHKGTDFRLISTEKAKRNVGVLAAAPGQVIGVRDGMLDRIFDITDANNVAGRECGNGVVIDHGDGWETQYCHLKRGSVVVKKGEQVRRGAKIGAIGFSGHAQFAHLHLEIRHNNAVVDPFTAEKIEKICDADATTTTTGLWQSHVATALHYRTGQVIETGFSGVVPKNPQDEVGLAALPKPQAKSEALLFLVRGINFSAGDRLKMTVTGPGGFKVEKTKRIGRAKATAAFYIGKALKDKTRWPAGRYNGQVVVLRGGLPIDEKRHNIAID